MLFFVRVFIMVTIVTSNIAMADAEKFISGSVIKNYGKHAKVQQDLHFDKNALFKVAFDISEQGKVGEVNRNGVSAENIHLALVVHGKAGFDLLKSRLYQEKFNSTNANSALLQDLMKNQVQIYLCGQSAAYYDIDKPLLEPGVKMALSAMTAHAVLNSKGYSLNPF